MLRKGLGVLMLLALPFVSFSWDCNTDLLDIPYYYDGSILSCFYSAPDGTYYYCHYEYSQGQLYGYCQKYIYQHDADAFYSFPLDLSDPLDYRFYGSCLFLGNQCGCSCDFSSGDGFSGDGFLGSGSSGGSPPVNLCSDFDEFNNLLLGIKHGLLKVFLASAFLVGLASASATVMRVKGWI